MFKRLVLGGSVGLLGVACTLGLRQWWRTWGVEPDEATRPLPGDDIVVDGGTLLTRGITIDAPAERVWPWLIQMGYGRAGWYSYDQLDMRGPSAVRIVPELQDVKVGDLLPTHPGGGFEVRSIDPGRALVLYLDSSLARRQAEAAGGSGISASETPGLAASDRFLRTASPPEFAVSWAFVIEPDGEGSTRLIERIRGRFGASTAGSRAMLPLMGFGVFLMLRKQLLGIRERVETIDQTEVPEAQAPHAASPGGEPAEVAATAQAIDGVLV
jgi:hypothetical protein